MRLYTMVIIIIIIIIIINPLTARVIEAPQMTLQPVFSIFSCSRSRLVLPSGMRQTPDLSILRYHLPTSSFVRHGSVMWWYTALIQNTDAVYVSGTEAVGSVCVVT